MQDAATSGHRQISGMADFYRWDPIKVVCSWYNIFKYYLKTAVIQLFHTFMKSLRDILLAAYFYVSTGNGIFSTTEYSFTAHILHSKNPLCTPPNKIQNIQNISFRTKQFIRADFVETLNWFWIWTWWSVMTLTLIVRVWKIQMPWNSAAQQRVVDVIFFFHYSAKTVQLTLV